MTDEELKLKVQEISSTVDDATFIKEMQTLVFLYTTVCDYNLIQATNKITSMDASLIPRIKKIRGVA
jgi:hypothetical protein